MAKKAKDSNISIEERLEQALIPNWDEPYKLPPNWCWTRIGTVTKLYRGVSYKKHEGHSEKSEDDCLVMRGGNILEGEIDVNADNIYVSKELVSDEQYVKKYDVVIVSSTGSTKVIGRAGISFADYDDVAFGAFLTLVRPVETLYKPYVSYYFQGDMYRNRMRQLASGVNINNIRNEYITDTPFPIPPLEEQKRIVSHIELLFAKLDDAKEKAQEVVDGFDTRKAAILHKAFSGELTAKWRKENKVSFEEWENLTLDDVADYKKGPFGSSITKAMFVPKGENTFKVYEQGNAIRKTLDYGSYYISQKKYEELKGFAVKPGDIIVSCAGTIGEIYKLSNHCEAGVINQALMRVRVYSNINELYFIYYFTGVLKGDVIGEANGTAIKNIPPFKVLKAMSILLPSLPEQNKIVEILDCMLSKEQQVKETAEAVIKQIDTMKKAILARAFRGELGTNDPSEESAIELLKKILCEDAVSQNPTKKPTKRITISEDIKKMLSTVREEEIIKLLLKSAPKPVSIQEIMSLSSKKFELMDALRSLEKKQLITKNESGEYSLTR